jgi:DNA-nicking Smr family endonuclease
MTAPSDHGRRRPRQLSTDEHRLWGTVTRSIKPLGRRKPPEHLDHPAAAPPVEKHPKPSAALRPPAPRAAAKVETGPPPLAPLERRLRQRLAKGSLAIDRRLDLHGLTQRQAHDALRGFIRSAQAEGARIVLVVTGKGARQQGSDLFAERGVLRRLVPQWLKGVEFRALVIGFETATIGHGGEGALYVRLRRPRERA